MLRTTAMAGTMLAILGGTLFWSISAEARTWTSASGAVQIEAELMEKRPDGTVVLKRADGTTLQTKLDKFSAADQEYVRQWTPPAAAEPGDEFDTSNAFGAAEAILTPEEKGALGKLKSAEAQAAVKAYEQREKELRDTYAKKQKEYREKLASLLEEALKEATTGGDLDDAVKIRDAIKALRSGQDPAIPQADSPPARGNRVVPNNRK